MLADQSIIEIGCGGGVFLNNFYGISGLETKLLCGIDISKNLLYNAMRNKKVAVDYIHTSVQTLPFKDETVDCVIAVSVFHHLVGKSYKMSTSNVFTCMEEAFRVLRRGGYLLIMERPSLKSKLISYFIYTLTRTFTRFHLKYEHYSIRKDLIVRFLTPDELVNMIEAIQPSAVITDFKVIPASWDAPLFQKAIMRLAGWCSTFIAIKKL
jgi:ubiquinone/menaquinone biosynthesis C-methylase UbiE